MMKKILLIGFLCFSGSFLFAQSSENKLNTEKKNELKSFSNTEGDKNKHPEAIYTEPTMELKDNSNTGGVKNKKEILINKKVDSNNKVKPTLKSGDSPKLNN